MLFRSLLIVILVVILIIFVGIVIFISKKIAEKIDANYKTEISEFKKKPLTEEIILENERKPVLIDRRDRKSVV